MNSEKSLSGISDSLKSRNALGLTDNEVIDNPRSKDVLLGRGAACLRHPGNRLFREIIDKAIPNYEKTSSRAHKAEIITIIYESVISNQGRFLKQDKETKKWHTVEKNHVNEKIAHAIRDRRANLEKSTREDSYSLGLNVSLNDISRQNVFLENSLKAPTKTSAALNLLITIASIRSRLKASEPAMQIMKHQNTAHAPSRRSILPINQRFELNPGKAMLPIPQGSISHSLHLRNQIEYHKRLVAQDVLSKLSSNAILANNLPIPQLAVDSLSSRSLFDRSFTSFFLEAESIPAKPLLDVEEFL